MPRSTATAGRRSAIFHRGSTCGRVPSSMGIQTVMTRRVARAVAGLGLLWAGVTVLAQAPPQTVPATVEEAEFFETSVRPLLANNCYGCHSSRVDAPFAGLRLDSRDGLLTGGDSGPAVIPGNPEESELIQRLRGRPVLMPPAGALDEDAITVLAEWVAMGVPWPAESAASASATPDPSTPFDLAERRRSHWAWQPITAAEVPSVKDTEWPATPVDRFILETLEAQDLAPARDADRATTIRRLSFDLRGLPPTTAEIARFLGDSRPTAYGDLVDRYLASPQFGERWARHWMDLFRYTESNGLEFDPDIPYAWRYRDYLIRGFNDDVSYDQLIREHLAGDLLPEPRYNAEARINESVIGAANLRLVEYGYQPVEPWEDRVRWIDNQVDVASKAFLGLTVSCARCHDHKFDAISQRDYYALHGTFYGARPTMRAIDDESYLETNKDALAQAKAEIRRTLSRTWSEAVGAVEASLLDVLRPESREAARAVGFDQGESGQVADPDSGSVLASWSVLAGIDPAGFSDAWRERRAYWETEIQDRERFEAEHFTVLWDLSGPDYRETIGHGTGRTSEPSAPGEFAIAPTGDAVLSGIYPGGAYTHLLSSKHAGVIQSPRFEIESDYISFRLLGRDLSFAQLIVENHAFPRGGVYQKRVSPKQDEMAWAHWDVKYWKGFTAYVEFATQDDVTHFRLDPEDRGLDYAPVRRGDGRSSIGANRIVAHDVEAFPGETVVPLASLLGDVVPTSHQALAALIVERLREAITAFGADRMTEQQAVFLDEFVRAGWLPRALDQLVDVQPLVAEYRTLEGAVPVARRVPGVIEERAPDQHLLVRGNHANLGEVVPRAFLSAIDGEAYRDPGLVRLQLADAITARDNPLTARVAVNRVWRHLFGYGVVLTVDNFGRLGELPSHPALLDYLAQEFADDGYSIKRLIRRLVLSRVYRLSSEPAPAAAERDPSNRLLQHANVRRLDAEAIRDSILSISGRLDPTMYGPSVPVRFAPRLGVGGNDPDNGPLDGEGRRSIYQEIRRNAHNPFLEVFDQPKPATTRGQRDSTNVPAQSLALLNSPYVIGQAREWGRRLAEGAPTTVEARVDHMFVKALGRVASARERARVMEHLSASAVKRGVSRELLLYDADAWQDVAHSLFNVKEFIFIR